MADIIVKQGVDLPILGKPQGSLKNLLNLSYPINHVALDLSPFDDVRFKLLVKKGEQVKIGQPLAYDKACPERLFVSPGGGTIEEVRRGLKRRLLSIVIALSEKEESASFELLNLETTSQEQLTELLCRAGLFATIRRRPFNLLADPKKSPRSIFVKAVDTAPFAPTLSIMIEGLEDYLQKGLTALKLLTEGQVHFVYSKEEAVAAVENLRDVEKHTVSGPHPSGNASVHIHNIDPIKSCDDIVWTIHVQDVIAIGHLLIHGEILKERVISIAGPALIQEHCGFFKVRAGYPVSGLIANRVAEENVRYISGGPLTGERVEENDFLGFYDTVFCAFKEQSKREFLSFFRLGNDKYTFSRGYMSGLLKKLNKLFYFTTNQHGERRAFIDGSLYNKVMPMKIPTMHLVKSVMAEDFDLAEELGLLEVDSEDFALPEFVCPSKVKMTEIIRHGLKEHAKEVLDTN